MIIKRPFPPPAEACISRGKKGSLGVELLLLLDLGTNLRFLNV